MRQFARPSWKPRGGAGSWTICQAQPQCRYTDGARCGGADRADRGGTEAAAAGRGRPPARSTVVDSQRGREGRRAATTAFDGLQLEENLAPIRKGSRIIKEISWRWREIGADGRICDLIDSQVDAIDAACTQLAETDPRVALRVRSRSSGRRSRRSATETTPRRRRLSTRCDP